nr:MAG TPA_asm: hypothetical protein [Caudoviricetes sp.]
MCVMETSSFCTCVQNDKSLFLAQPAIPHTPDLRSPPWTIWCKRAIVSVELT